MKKILLSFFILFAVFALADNKRYDIKSGIIKYSVETKGNSFGVNTQMKGTRTVYFKDWGAVELRDENTTENIMGQINKTNSLVKLENENAYSVDFEQNVIIKMDIGQFNQNTKLNSEKMLKTLNGQKIGTEKVLGYKCDIWEVLGSKVWVYKGVPLKVESTMMGIKTIEIASSAKFNTSIPSNKFDLPNFPVKSFAQMMNEEMGGEMQEESDETESFQMPPNMPSQEEMMKMLQNFQKNMNTN